MTKLNVLKHIEHRLWCIVLPAIGFASTYSFAYDWLAKWIGDHAANVLIGVSLSVIAAFVFYLFLEIPRRRREVRSIAPHVSRQIKMLKDDAQRVCKEAAHVSGAELPSEWKFRPDEVEKFFERANPNDPARMIFNDRSQAKLIDYLIDMAGRGEAFLDNLLQISFLLDGEGIARITDVKRSSYIRMLLSMRSMRNPTEGNKNLSFLSRSFIEYYRAIEKLESWASQSGLLIENPWR
jgi:hypothetical protein